MGLGVPSNTSAVPVTLKHFQLLARLGRSPVCLPVHARGILNSY
jgi:hypothetical protein